MSIATLYSATASNTVNTTPFATRFARRSNVRALEATATYDQATDEWVLDTPTLTSTKFWPGSLGKTANTAMVIAQLVDGEGVRRGVHNFIGEERPKPILPCVTSLLSTSPPFLTS